MNYSSDEFNLVGHLIARHMGWNQSRDRDGGDVQYRIASSVVDYCFIALSVEWHHLVGISGAAHLFREDWSYYANRTKHDLPEYKYCIPTG